MKIGILRETKLPVERRAPLTPGQCRRLLEQYPGLKLLVQPAPKRVFPDEEYRRAGAELLEDLSDCDLLLGIKEVRPEDLIAEKTYAFYSHTIKKQAHNREMLQTILKKGITLIDLELFKGEDGKKLLGFGRFAGIVGAYLAIQAIGLRTGFYQLEPVTRFDSLKQLQATLSVVNVPPWRIAVIGRGYVAKGAELIISAAGFRRVSVEDYLQKDYDFPVYVELAPSDFIRSKTGEPFTKEAFRLNPDHFDGNFHRFLPITDLAVTAAYWDPRGPQYFTLADLKEDNFSIRIVADIACDVNGPVPSTLRSTTIEAPFYDFNPVAGKEEKPFSNPENITTMAVDNLPTILAREGSEIFGGILLEKVLPLLLSGRKETFIEQAIITRKGKLSPDFNYLSDYVSEG